MTSKMFQAKRKHHHVWADYLKRWAPNGRDVYYTTVRGKIVCESVRGVAMEEDFYQLTQLSPEHVDMIKVISSKSPEKLHESHMSYLGDVLKMQKMESLYHQFGRRNEELEKLLFSTKCNLLENLHMSHESAAKPIIQALSEGDVTILQKEKRMIEFMMFFGHQISRTKNFRDAVVSGLSRNTVGESYVADLMIHSWWFVSYMYGMSMGHSFYFSRKESCHSLLINNTGVPFVTSDQPIINVHTCVTDVVSRPPEFGDFYYPISPSIAYMVNDSERFPSGLVSVSEADVEELNVKMAKRAQTHIFGNTEESIRSVVRYLGGKS